MRPFAARMAALRLAASMAAVRLAAALAATAVVVDDCSKSATAVSVDDGSATGGVVIGNNGAAFGPMHVMHCMCAGGPEMPYLVSFQCTEHGFAAHIWTLSFVPGPYTAFVLRLTIAHPVVPSWFFVFLVGGFGRHRNTRGTIEKHRL